VIDRHHASGRRCVAFVRGLELTSGALACSFGGAAQQLIVAGADDSSMLEALHAVIASQGGAAVAEYGAVTASLALPVAGLLSDLSAEELSTQLEALRQAVTGLGCQYSDPFAALASLAAVELGGVRISEQGICDIATGRLLALQDRDTDWLGA
jgi:adenine deaminase